MARAQVRAGVAAANVGRLDLAGGLAFVESLGKDSGVPWVSANLKRKGGEAPFPRWRILSWGNRKIAVFGLVRPDPGRDDKMGIEVEEPVSAAAAVLKEMPAADAVICLSNLGLSWEMELARRVQGIAFIVGGGSVEVLASPQVVGDTVILHAGDKGKYVGVLEVSSAALGPRWRSPKDVQERIDLEARLAGARAEVAALGPGTEAQLLAKAGADTQKSNRVRAAFRSLAKLQASVAEFDKAPALYSHRLEALDGSAGEDAETASWVKGFKDSEAALRQRATASASASTPRAPSGAPLHLGSAACRECHPDAYRAWLGTRHSRSYLSLRGREQERGCTDCHASILQRASGALMEPAVACEACHGPGANHHGRGNVARKPPEELCRRCHRGFHPDEKFDGKVAYARVRCDRK